ncbi:MAG TPA: hypothetical protein VGL12_02450 [Roseiarcus sp.]|jgi:hypothetical protein
MTGRNYAEWIGRSDNGTSPGKDGVAKLWAANVDGRLAMTAEATLAERAR